MLQGWKDTSSYSRSEQDRRPKEWTLTVEGGRVCIHRVHWAEPDRWFVSAYFWGGSVANSGPLGSTDTEGAQREAVTLVLTRLRQAADELAALRGGR